jgi:hypothetical protein
MFLRRPFVAPRSTLNKSVGSKAIGDKEGDFTSPQKTGISNQDEGYDQIPISEWKVSDDEEDLVPISQLIVGDKPKVVGHRKDNSE